MKKLITADILILIFLLNSCEPPATFDKPQPENIKPETSFPQNLQGEYLSVDQTSILTITNDLITRHYDYDLKVHKDSISSSYRLVGDTLIDQIDGTKEKVLVKGDTVIQHEDWTDTLFNKSADNVLKKFKGYYFLNSRYSDNSWEVKKISLKKGILNVSSISDENDIQKLKEITETTADTTSTLFTLPRRKFKKFIRQDGFGEQETFSRITINGR